MSPRTTFPVKTTFFDASTFFAGSLMSKTTLFNWLKGPMTIKGLALCSGVNALSIAAADHWSPSQRKSALTLATLALNTAFVCVLAKPLARYTSIVIGPLAAMQLTCFHVVIKVTTFGAYQMARHYYHSFSFGKFKTLQDIKTLSSNNIGACKVYFEKHEPIWDALPIKIQAAFNVLLGKSGLSALPFTNFSGKDRLSPDELRVFLNSLENTLSDGQMEVLYRNQSAKTIGLYHELFLKTPIALSPQQQQHFARYFFNHNLPPPTETFLLTLSIPAAAASITSTQALYYLKSFGESFASYPLNEQVILHAIFAKCKVSKPLRDPELAEIPDLSDLALEVYKKRYETQLVQWRVKGKAFQEAFNQALEQQSMDSILISQEPMPTWQKVSIAAGALFLILAGTATIFYMTQVTIKTQNQESRPPPSFSPIPLKQQATAVERRIDFIDIQNQCFIQSTNVTAAVIHDTASFKNAPVVNEADLAQRFDASSICGIDNYSPLGTMTQDNSLATQTSTAPTSKEFFIEDKNQCYVSSFAQTAQRIEQATATCQAFVIHESDTDSLAPAISPKKNANLLTRKLKSAASPSRSATDLSTKKVLVAPEEGYFSSLAKWLTPLIGLACICINCGKKKNASLSTKELHETDSGAGFDIGEATFPNWDQAVVKAIPLDKTVGHQKLPSNLADHNHKIEFSAGGTKYAKDTNKKTLKSLPSALKFLKSRPGWQNVAKTVSYVAFQIIATIGTVENLSFDVTLKDGEVQLVIHSKVSSEIYKADILFDTVKKLEDLNPSRFDITRI